MSGATYVQHSLEQDARLCTACKDGANLHGKQGRQVMGKQATASACATMSSQPTLPVTNSVVRGRTRYTLSNCTTILYRLSGGTSPSFCTCTIEVSTQHPWLIPWICCPQVHSMWCTAVGCGWISKGMYAYGASAMWVVCVTDMTMKACHATTCGTMQCHNR